MKLHRFHYLIFTLSLILCLWFDGNIPIVATPAPTAVVRQGIELYHAGDFRGAIAVWLKKLTEEGKANQQESDIQVRQYLARAYQKVGEVDKAINNLNKVVEYYRTNNNMQQVGRMLTEVAQAYSNLGQHKRAINLLCGDMNQAQCNQNSALGIANRQQDSLGEAAANGSLGNALYFLGEYDRAIQILGASYKKSQELGNSGYLMAAANNLGNLYTSLAQRNYRYINFARETDDSEAVERFTKQASLYETEAIRYFENSLQFARVENNTQGEVSALLNLVVPYYRNRGMKQDRKFNQKIFQQIETKIENLPPSRQKAFALIKLARLMQKVNGDSRITASAYECFQGKSSAKVVNLFERGLQVAQSIGDKQTQSFALGWLGHVYECSGNYRQALNFTNQAQIAAATKESRYLWEWQAGRIYKAQNEAPQAIKAYESSANTLEDIEKDIAIANRDIRLDFQDSVETIYRNLAELRVKSAIKDSKTSTEKQQQNLESALNTLDKLRLAELRNYLGSDCDLQLIDKPIAQVDKNTAVFRSIILEDGIAIVLMLPESDSVKLKMHWVPISKQAAVETVNQFRINLEKLSDRRNSYRKNGKEIYDWFITPFAKDLEQIKTLVFVQDGVLWTIPMGTLYDGKQFLIEKYAIASTPSLSLTSPQPLNSKNLKILAFGLTDASAIDKNTYFPPLGAVKAEMQGINKVISNSKILLNENFTSQQLQQKLRQYQPDILHLATHARFGYDSAQTFLIAGEQKKNIDKTQKYNKTISLGNLYQIIQNTQQDDNEVLELLTLTGCQTAVGSQRDALGIAGVSLQAGARSSVASLWNIDDEATARIIVQFYDNLRQGMSKAEALQTTQKNWLAENSQGRYAHPGYWAPFVLIGNWL
ncbi:MAG: CHAT domain-containing protein [Rivularia sp. (in: Bacteria)]|nr:CHAT domain-containing protein [Rivularia sp. MS3]